MTELEMASGWCLSPEQRQRGLAGLEKSQEHGVKAWKKQRDYLLFPPTPHNLASLDGTMLIALSFCSLSMWAAVWTQYFKCAPLFCKSNKLGVLIIPSYNKEIRVFRFTKFTQIHQRVGFEPRSAGHQNQFSCPHPHLHTIYSATTTSLQIENFYCIFIMFQAQY